MGKEGMKFKEQVIVILKDAKTGKVVKRVEQGPNIVTDYGDEYYAEMGAGEVPSLTFAIDGMMVVANSFTKGAATFGKTARFSFFVLSPAASYSGRIAFDSGYPKTSDSDTDNTGRTADAVTYKTTYGTSAANTEIQAIGICQINATTAAAAPTSKLLSFKTLSAAEKVTKTSSQTLVVYINHTFLGA
jgi:hypothetical protein